MGLKKTIVIAQRASPFADKFHPFGASPCENFVALLHRLRNWCWPIFCELRLRKDIFL